MNIKDLLFYRANFLTYNISKTVTLDNLPQQLPSTTNKRTRKDEDFKGMIPLNILPSPQRTPYLQHSSNPLLFPPLDTIPLLPSPPDNPSISFLQTPSLVSARRESGKLQFFPPESSVRTSRGATLPEPYKKVQQDASNDVYVLSQNKGRCWRFMQ